MQSLKDPAYGVVQEIEDTLNILNPACAEAIAFLSNFHDTEARITAKLHSICSLPQKLLKTCRQTHVYAHIHTFAHTHTRMDTDKDSVVRVQSRLAAKVGRWSSPTARRGEDSWSVGTQASVRKGSTGASLSCSPVLEEWFLPATMLAPCRSLLCAQGLYTCVHVSHGADCCLLPMR